MTSLSCCLPIPHKIGRVVTVMFGHPLLVSTFSLSNADINCAFYIFPLCPVGSIKLQSDSAKGFEPPVRMEEFQQSNPNMDVIVLGCPPPINREDKKIRRARRKEESSLMGRRALKLSSFPYVATAFDHDAGSFALLLVRGSLVQVMATFFWKTSTWERDEARQLVTLKGGSTTLTLSLALWEEIKARSTVPIPEPMAASSLFSRSPTRGSKEMSDLSEENAHWFSLPEVSTSRGGLQTLDTIYFKSKQHRRPPQTEAKVIRGAEAERKRFYLEDLRALILSSAQDRQEERGWNATSGFQQKERAVGVPRRTELNVFQERSKSTPPILPTQCKSRKEPKPRGEGRLAWLGDLKSPFVLPVKKKLLPTTANLPIIRPATSTRPLSQQEGEEKRHGDTTLSLPAI
mmetsp:Transcript_26742/g.68742  ORF Transcript_26742/g.68742 Transcript_26742/m.68742 type:complete len:403 (-) Transcript_26742:828-2036(-)